MPAEAGSWLQGLDPSGLAALAVLLAAVRHFWRRN